MDKRSLNAAYLRSTIERLAERIGARFPQRNLAAIAAELVTVMDETVANIERQRSRMVWARRISLAVIVLLVLTGIVAVWCCSRAPAAASGTPRCGRRSSRA